MSEDTTTDVLRWYTLGRRLQRMIGKAPGGGHYPGGPYTMVQATGAAVVCIVGAVTMRFWGRWWNGLTSYAVLFTLTLATLFALRLVKAGGRNPLSALSGVVSVLSGPQHGRYAGRSVKARRSHTVRHHILVATPCPAPTVRPTSEPMPAAVPAAHRVATLVARWSPRSTHVTRGRHLAAPTTPVQVLPPAPEPAGDLVGASASAAPVAALSSVQSMLANIEGNH